MVQPLYCGKAGFPLCWRHQCERLFQAFSLGAKSQHKAPARALFRPQVLRMPPTPSKVDTGGMGGHFNSYSGLGTAQRGAFRCAKHGSGARSSNLIRYAALSYLSSP